MYIQFKISNLIRISIIFLTLFKNKMEIDFFPVLRYSKTLFMYLVARNFSHFIF